jgi:hypothetical protein
LTNLCASSGRVPPLRVGAERFEHLHCVVPVLGTVDLGTRLRA